MKMKCLICKKGTMKEVSNTIEQDDIKFEAFECSSCGEKIVDMKQLEVLARKYHMIKRKSC